MRMWWLVAVAAPYAVAAQTVVVTVRGATTPVTGRVFVYVTRDSAPEPRFQGGSLGLTATFCSAAIALLRALMTASSVSLSWPM